MKIGSVVDGFVDAVDYSIRSLGDLIFGKAPVDAVDLLTVHNDKTLVLKGGALLSTFRIDGCGSVVGQEEFSKRVDALSEVFSIYLRKDSGHTVKITYESDTENVVDDLSNRLAGARAQSRIMGLAIDDLLDEKIEANARFCHRETVYFCLYTHPQILSKSELSNANKAHERDVANLPKVGSSQKVNSYLTSITSTHESAVKSFEESLSHVGLTASPMVTDDILRNIVYQFQGPECARGWIPDTIAWGDNKLLREQRLESLTSKKLPSAERKYERYLRLVTDVNNKSLEPVIPRSIPDQVLGDTYYTVGNYVVAKDKIYSPVHVVQHCSSPVDFDQLINSMRGTPFRVTFTLTPSGLSGDYVNSLLTGNFSWVSTVNTQINTARKQLRKYEELGGCVPGFSIVAATWANKEEVIDAESGRAVYKTAEVQKNTNKLLSSLNSWGGTQAAATTVDPLEALASTIPGLTVGHVTSIVPAPLHDVVQLLPISRVRSSWSKGAVLYRTEDGTPISYEQFSPEQNAWITLIAGPMGTAKSSHINGLNYAFLTQSADSEKLPYLRGIDFGYSGQGVVEIIRSGLPDSQKHRAQYIRMENDARFSVNVWDTLLGCRKPIPNHVTFLGNFLQSIANSIRGYPSLQGLSDLCVKEAYKRYTDENHNSGAKRYSRGTCPEIDLALSRIGIEANDGSTTWWSIVDRLADVEEYQLAGLAQRYAVPCLEDIVGIATSAAVTSEYGESFNGQPVTEMFSRAIRESIDSLPFIRSVTQFDISQSEVLLLDLASMIPSGAALSEQQKVTASIIYLVAMRVLSCDFFVGMDDIQFINEKYVSYHSERFKELSTVKKRFFVDERHRIQGVASAEAQTDQMVVEGRKYFVDSMQGSQEFNDFSKKVQNQATTIILCGSGSPEATKQIGDHYGLNSTQRAILNDLRGPVPGKGAPALFSFKTKRHGQQFLRLVNTEGPLMLWAIATEAQDRYVRARLYQLCTSTSDARKRLAKMFPGGSVKAELKRRQELMEQDLYVRRNANLLDDLVQELLDLKTLT